MERDEEGSDVAEEVIRARRIELYDDQDNLTGILSGGGVEEEESSVAVLMLHSPDGEAAASIAMHRDSGNPSICTPQVVETSSSTSTTKAAPW